MNNRFRLALLIILATASVGLISYSRHSVSYASDTGRMSEYRVTELSLTDEVERGKNGKLVDLTQSEDEQTANTAAATPAKADEPAEKAVVAPVSGLKSRNTNTTATVTEENAAQTLTSEAATKPAPNKKPTPKKPAPPKKKPGKKKGKACPT